MSRKPKSKLPAGWDVYTGANRKPVKQRGSGWWKYGAWAVVLAGLAGIAFYPWQF